MATISALVLVYNEEEQIRQCLDTVSWADEIVICDSCSTDRTLEICREYTDKIYQRPFDDFGRQQQWSLDKPSCDWVLFVEADERFSPELRDEIHAAVNGADPADGYRMPFVNHILGRRMRSRYWQFSKVKLYRRGIGRWQDRAVHGHFIVDGRVAELRNPVHHYPYRDLGVLRAKMELSTGLEARQLLREGRACTLSWMARSLFWVPVTFFRFYITWGGWRDGWQGLVVALMSAPYNLMVFTRFRRMVAR